MKKLILLVSLVSISFGLSAQYYYVPFMNAGKNPDNLNTDIEQPFGALTGWTMIRATSSTPAWSPVTAIPIPFNFNGSPATFFKASTSGVVTFDTAATAVPSSTNAALPSASIPDNSICAWGLSGTGANDAIITKTFGNAPNRQFWIEFNTFSFPGIDVSSGWSYWAIVLEETTNSIYIVDLRTYNAGPQQPSLTLGLQISSTEAYSVTGSPNIGSASFDAYDQSDNSYYKFSLGAPPANDIELTSLDIPGYAATNVTIKGKITNRGLNAITSFNVQYQAGGSPVSYTQNGVNIASGQTYNFTHTTPLAVTASVNYSIKVWAELAGDLLHSNDTLTAATIGLSFMPVKNIVFEEATGTWCGWCPGGAVYMDSLHAIHPDRANLIAVHDYDPMMDLTNGSEYDNGIYNMISGYPAGIVDRKYVNVDPYDFIAAYDQVIQDIAPCEVSVTTSLNAATRVLTINLSGHFAKDFSGDYRFNAVVTEDDVKGTASGYAQKNYYSYASQNLPLTGAGHNWQAEPNPIAAANMEYDHVARAILGGFNSKAGSLPSTLTANGVYPYTFTYTVPAGYNINKLKVVGWICNGTTGEILNSAKVNSIVGIREESQNALHLVVYPNPSTGLVSISSSIKGNSMMKLIVMNSLGETVKIVEKLDVDNGSQVIDLSSCGNGLYFLQFIDENNAATVSKLLINR